MSPPKGPGGSVGRSSVAANGVVADAVADASADANVDKIREILFGGQMQDYELRFTALENRLAGAASELREDMRGRLEALEAYTKRELAALADRLATEQSERSEAVAQAAADAEATSMLIERRLDAHDERTTRDHGDLRDQILQQSKSLNDDLRRVERSLSEMIDGEIRALRAATADRQKLARILADAAVRLSGDAPDEPRADPPDDATS